MELKDFLINRFSLRMIRVSNSPCGVESKMLEVKAHNLDFVSNSPCGVERTAFYIETSKNNLCF